MSTVTKPIALDETLQSTNTALGSLGKDTTLQAIATAIVNVGLSNIGNMSSLATTDKTSLVSAINEVVGDVSDLDTDKADKVTSATSGNLAGLNASGNLTDSGVAANNVVKKSGDTMTGTLTVQTESIVPTIYLKSPAKENVGRAIGSIYKNTSSTVDNGTSVIDYTWGETTKRTVLTVRDTASLTDKLNLTVRDSNGTSTNYKVFGEHNSNAYDNTDKAKVDKIDTTTTSASGNPISITGLKSNQLAVNPVITFEPIQAGSGDPSPSNVRAISGYDKIEVLSCGKNLYDKNNLLAGLVTTNGYINTSTATWKHSYTPIVPNKQYTLQGIQPTGFQYAFYNANGEFIEVIQSETVPKTFTTPNNAYYIAINTTSSTYENTTQLELGNQATTYEPYHKTTDLSEPLPQTVYGGSLDVRTGKLTSELGFYTFDGTELWVINNQTAYLEMTQMKQGFNMSGYCSKLGIGAQNGKLQLGNNNKYIYLIGCDTYGLSTRADIQAFMQGVQLAFPINPFTIQLTPHEISLLKDYAYVSTNGTSIALDYYNGEIATLGDVSQLGETVEGLGKHLTPVGYGTPEIITPDANYTVPSMGFVTIQAAKNAVITFWNYTPGINRGFIISGGASNANTCVIPVFGGMIVKVIQSSGTADAVFYPYKYADA